MADDLLSILGGNDPEPVAASQGAPQARKPGGANSAMADPASALHGALGGAVTITSLRRSAEHNAEVGGVPDSYHLTGHAVDFHPPAGMTNAQAVARLRQSGMPFVELLDEGNHVHVAWNGPSVGEMKSGGGSMAGSDDLLSLLGGSDSAPATAPATAPIPAAAPTPQTVKPDADTAYSQAFSGLRPIERVARWNDKGELVRPDTGKPFPAAVSKTYAMLMKGGLLSPDAPVGSAKNPLVQDDPANTPTPGQFYIEANTGVLKQQPIPNAPKPGVLAQAAQVGTGFGRGIGDVVQSVGNLLPGGQDSELGAQLDANRLMFNAVHAGDGWAQVGRVGGQMAATGPVLGADIGLAAAGKAAPMIAPVADFLAGKAGGNLIMRGASLAAHGAGQGAAASALTSADSEAPVGQQAAIGAGIGAILGPAGAIAGRALGGAGRALAPFSEGGRNKIVDSFLASRSAGGPVAADLTPYVPGSTPTLAQATANPALATLERGVKAINPTPFDAIAKGNQQARELAVDALRGDKQSLDDLIASRSAQTDPMREAVFAKSNAFPTDPSPAIDKIDEILASPAGQRDAVKSALTSIRGKLVDGDKTLQTDPEQLWGVRQAIGDMISPMAAGTKNDGRLAARELMGVRDALDPVIEKGAPGFQDYLKSYADASKGVNAQEFLQSLKLADSQGNMTLGRVDSALTRVEAMRAKGGANAAKDIPDAAMQQLYALRDDLRRQANSDLGRGSGSDTFQKLATNGVLGALSVPAALGIGVHGPMGAAAVGLGKLAYGAKNRQIMDLLTNKLLDPTLGVPALQVGLKQPNMILDALKGQMMPASMIAGRNLLAPAQ